MILGTQEESSPSVHDFLSWVISTESLQCINCGISYTLLLEILHLVQHLAAEMLPDILDTATMGTNMLNKAGYSTAAVYLH